MGLAFSRRQRYLNTYSAPILERFQLHLQVLLVFLQTTKLSTMHKRIQSKTHSEFSAPPRVFNSGGWKPRLHAFVCCAGLCRKMLTGAISQGGKTNGNIPQLLLKKVSQTQVTFSMFLKEAPLLTIITKNNGQKVRHSLFLLFSMLSGRQ